MAIALQQVHVLNLNLDMWESVTEDSIDEIDAIHGVPDRLMLLMKKLIRYFLGHLHHGFSKT